MLQRIRNHFKISAQKPRCGRMTSPQKRLAGRCELLEERALLTEVAAAGPGVNWVAASTSGTDTFNVQVDLKLDTDGDKIADDSTTLTGTATVLRGNPIDTNGDGYKDTVPLELVNFSVSGNYIVPFTLNAGDGIGNLQPDDPNAKRYSPGSIKAESQNSYFATTAFDINYDLTADGKDYPDDRTFQADHVDRFAPFASVYVSNDYTTINSDLHITHAEFRMIPTDNEPVGQFLQNGEVVPAPGVVPLYVQYSSNVGYFSDLSNSSLYGAPISAIASNGATASATPAAILPGGAPHIDPSTHQVTGGSSVVVIYSMNLSSAGNYVLRVPGGKILDSGGLSMQAQSLGGFTVLGPNSPLITANVDTFVLGGSGSNNASGNFSVLANDVSADQQPQNLKAAIVSTVTHGSLTLNQNGSFTYTPDSSFQGIDRFTYQVSESDATSTATVTLFSYHASLVDKLYHQVLGRSAELNGLIFWTQQLDAGASLDAVGQGIFLSPERLSPLVAQFYHEYLGRDADTDGLNFWVNDWQTRKDPAEIVLLFLSGPEFLKNAGHTSDGFVVYLYRQLLHREATTTDRGFWDPMVLATDDEPGVISRQQVAAQFYQSKESHQKIVDFLFSEYFQGTARPDPAPFVSLLDQGQTRTQVELAIIDSAAYQNTPPRPTAGSVVRALYDYRSSG